MLVVYLDIICPRGPVPAREREARGAVSGVELMSGRPKVSAKRPVSVLSLVKRRCGSNLEKGILAGKPCGKFPGCL